MLHQFHFHQIHCPQFLGEFSWQDWQACLPQQNGGFHTEKTLPKMNWHCRNLELGEWLLMAKILLTRHYRQVTSTIPSFAVFSIICCTTRIPKFSISFHSDLMSFFWYLQGLNQGLPLLHVFFFKHHPWGFELIPSRSLKLLSSFRCWWPKSLTFGYLAGYRAGPQRIEPRK